jgi:hypothetical protein
VRYFWLAGLVLATGCVDVPSAPATADAGGLDATAIGDDASNADAGLCTPVLLAAESPDTPTQFGPVQAGGAPERVFVVLGYRTYTQLVSYRDGRWQVLPSDSNETTYLFGPDGTAFWHSIIHSEGPYLPQHTYGIIYPNGTLDRFAGPLPLALDRQGNGIMYDGARGRTYEAHYGWHDAIAIAGSPQYFYPSSSGAMSLDGSGLAIQIGVKQAPGPGWLEAASFLPGSGWRFMGETAFENGNLMLVASADGGGWIAQTPTTNLSVRIWRVDPTGGLQPSEDPFLDDPAFGPPTLRAMWTEPDGVSVVFDQLRSHQGLWWARYRAGQWSTPVAINQPASGPAAVAAVGDSVVATWTEAGALKVARYSRDLGWQPEHVLLEGAENPQVAVTESGAATVVYYGDRNAIWACRFDLADL